MESIVTFLRLTLLSMVPFVLAGQGTMLGGRTGVFNVAQEGIMLVGASVGSAAAETVCGAEVSADQSAADALICVQPAGSSIPARDSPVTIQRVRKGVRVMDRSPRQRASRLGAGWGWSVGAAGCRPGRWRFCCSVAQS